jgi:hypothetical protein
LARAFKFDSYDSLKICAQTITLAITQFKRAFRSPPKQKQTTNAAKQFFVTATYGFEAALTYFSPIFSLDLKKCVLNLCGVQRKFLFELHFKI